MGNMSVKVIPVVVGALGAIPKKLKQWLSDTWIETRIVKLQKTAILYSAKILQNVLRFKESCWHRRSKNLATDSRPIQCATPT